MLVSVYMLYTEGIIRYTDFVWKARIQSLQDFLFIITQVRIYDVYCMKQEGTDMFRRRFVYRFLHS